MCTSFFTACSLLARRVRETPRRFACSFANCSTTELLWNIGYNDALVFFTACSLLARRVKETPRRFACSFANCSTTELLWNVVCNDALAFLLLVGCSLIVSERLL